MTYLYAKTWYQENPDQYNHELLGKFENFERASIFLEEHIHKIEDDLPVIEIIISRVELEYVVKINKEPKRYNLSDFFNNFLNKKSYYDEK